MNRVLVHSMDESRSVVEVEGSRGCDTLSLENSHGELLAKPTVGAGREKVCWCINVNHRHGKAAKVRTRLDIYINRRKTN